MFLDSDEVQLIGKSLRRIKQSSIHLQNDKHLIRIWYQGNEPYCDLFADRDDQTGEIDWFQFTLRGFFVSWSRQHRHWLTGVTNEMESNDLLFYPASKLLKDDNATDLSFLEIVRLICEQRRGEELFDRILQLFE